MPTVYIIAGPPGVGKSTKGSDFIPRSIETLNHDKLNAEYKDRKIPDYEDRANLKANAFIKEKLSQKVDFGVELNLGSDGHYDFLRYLSKHYSHYTISVLLFFSDEITLCLNRAFIREQAGGHRVEPAIIQKMYKNTLLLLRANIQLINYLQFINTTYYATELVYAGYYLHHQNDFIHLNLPRWVIKHFPEIANLHPSI